MTSVKRKLQHYCPKAFKMLTLGYLVITWSCGCGLLTNCQHCNMEMVDHALSGKCLWAASMYYPRKADEWEVSPV